LGPAAARPDCSAGGTFFVVQSVDVSGDKVQRPFADLRFAEVDVSSGGHKRLSIGQQ
jgi:hypothetical protein